MRRQSLFWTSALVCSVLIVLFGGYIAQGGALRFMKPIILIVWFKAIAICFIICLLTKNKN